MTPPTVASPEVADAISRHRAVVALETTIVTHGMPWPQNLETALAVEDTIREAGATPATIALVDGAIRVGLDRPTLTMLAQAKDVLKVSTADLPFALTKRRLGATTVAATMIAARSAGIGVFATGGIGGVHRGAETSFDISADLTELGRTGVVVVAAGAKALLDLPKTLEVLETIGRAGRVLSQRRIPGVLVAFVRAEGAASPRRTERNRRLRSHARATGTWRRRIRRQPDTTGRRNSRQRDQSRHRGGDPGGRSAGRHRQGRDAVPARRDPQGDGWSKPHRQHRAGEKQCSAGGRSSRRPSPLRPRNRTARNTAPSGRQRARGPPAKARNDCADTSIAAPDRSRTPPLARSKSPNDSFS